MHAEKLTLGAPRLPQVYVLQRGLSLANMLLPLLLLQLLLLRLGLGVNEGLLSQAWRDLHAPKMGLHALLCLSAQPAD